MSKIRNIGLLAFAMLLYTVSAHSGQVLYRAAVHGDEKTIHSLLKAGANVDQQDSLGRTTLMLAARGNHDKITQLLLRAGADVDQLDNKGHSPLVTAALHNRRTVVQMLLEHGASPPTTEQWTTLSGMNQCISTAEIDAAKKLIAEIAISSMSELAQQMKLLQIARQLQQIGEE